MLCFELLRELHDFTRISHPAMDHYAVSPCLDIGTGTSQGVVHSRLEYQALDPGDHHEVWGYLCGFTDADFPAKGLDVLLFLEYLRAQQRVPLESTLVLDHDRRNPQALHGTNMEGEVFGEPARIAIGNQRKGGSLKYFVDVE
ncbi:hypothetical protein D3C76_1309770 [compost metagenome]